MVLISSLHDIHLYLQLLFLRFGLGHAWIEDTGSYVKGFQQMESLSAVKPGMTIVTNLNNLLHEITKSSYNEGQRIRIQK